MPRCVTPSAGFNRAVIDLGLVTKELLLERLAITDIGEELRRIVQERIKRDFKT